MVTLEILRERGVSADAWRKIFEGRDYFHAQPPNERGDPQKDNPKPPAKIKEGTNKDQQISNLCDHVRSRIQGGMDYNLDTYRIPYALDLAWEAPFRQMTPTLLAGILENNKSPESVANALKTFGFDVESVVRDSGRTDKTGKPIKEVVVPAFFSVMVPLVRPYLNTRRAKIVNDRAIRPMIKYEPAINTAENRARAEALTSRVQVMADQYNFVEALNQGVFQMLQYGYCLQFTKEEWHSEEQLRYKTGQTQTPITTTEDDAADAKDDTTKDDDTEAYVVKEGVRYCHPHPSRTYWDQAHPVKSFNTDTGCQFGGHWTIMRYGELKRMRGVYNLDKVSIGATTWWSRSANLFSTVLSNCVIKIPNLEPPSTVADRESWLAENPYYNDAMTDQSVQVVEHREKIVPSEWGLGNYDHPVWVRFVVAGDGTIIYAAPIPYPPITVYKDNGDEKRLNDASLALQLTPYQDLLSNLVTQLLYTCKQNLANVTFFDQNLVTADVARSLRNLGGDWYTGINMFPVDPKNPLLRQSLSNNIFWSHIFPKVDPGMIIQAMKVVIDIAERVLQFSSQEIAQAASHEQTKHEVEVIQSTTTNVLQYTGLPVDQALYAQSVQIYQALMNFGEDDFFAAIPSEIRLDKKRLEAMGFTTVTEPMNDRDGRVVKVKKSAISLMSFAWVPNIYNRVSNVTAAQAMAQFVQTLLANPMTSQGIGPQQFIDMANQIADLAGLPLERPLKFTGQTPEQARAELMEVANAVLTEAKKGMAEVVKLVSDQKQRIDTLYQTLGLSANGTTTQQIGTGQGATDPRLALATAG